jgi:hypothetical protein
MLASVRNVPFLIWDQTSDELVPIAGVLEQVNTFDALGYRYEFDQFQLGEHVTLAINDEFAPAAAFLGTDTIVSDPPHVSYAYNPTMDFPADGTTAGHAYWLYGITLRNASGTAPLGTIDVRSEGFGVGDPTPSPTQHGTGVMTGGQFGAIPFTSQSKTWEPALPEPARDALDITATNVSQVTIDPVRAKVDCAAHLNVTSDGPLTVTLAGCPPTVVSHPGPPASLVLSPKTSTSTVGTHQCLTATVKDASANPTPNISVVFSVSGSVNTSGTRTTNTSGNAQFCYQGPQLPGQDLIKAFADTDNNGSQDLGEPFDTATKTWVLPVSTPGCAALITNGGWIIADNGDRANFGGNAQVPTSGPPEGHEQYTDHGPAAPISVSSLNVLAVVCNSDNTQADIYGEATINGAGSHTYRISVADPDPTGGADRYRIVLDTGYDSGEHTLGGGNIEIHR